MTTAQEVTLTIGMQASFALGLFFGWLLWGRSTMQKALDRLEEFHRKSRPYGYARDNEAVDRFLAAARNSSANEVVKP